MPTSVSEVQAFESIEGSETIYKGSEIESTGFNRLIALKCVLLQTENIS